MSSVHNNQLNGLGTGSIGFDASDNISIDASENINFEAGDNINFKVGKSGGSINQPSDSQWSRRGLAEGQEDPLALWWVRLLKAEYSADGKTPRSYRRSRWGHAAEKRVSAASPYLTMHRQGRLLTSFLCAAALGLIASLNMVAQAETGIEATTSTASETPSSMRLSMMKDFVGRHNQYLDLSKLSEFKWSDEIKLAAKPPNRKRQAERVYATRANLSSTQPQAVRLKNAEPIKNDAELTDRLQSSFEVGETRSNSASSLMLEKDPNVKQ